MKDDVKNRTDEPSTSNERYSRSIGMVEIWKGQNECVWSMFEKK